MAYFVKRVILIENLTNGILIDALEVTLHDCSVDFLKDLLSLDDAHWEYEPFGRNNYPRKTHFRNIDILYGCDDPENYGGDTSKIRLDMGIRLEMSGKGCRAFESYSRLSWSELFVALDCLPVKVKFGRIDLAYDDHEGVLDLDQIIDDADHRYFTSPSRKGSKIISWDDDDMITGRTLYIGSKKNDVFTRIYDKAAEREYSDGDRHWVRVEIVCRHDRANICCGLLQAGMEPGKVFSGLLMNYCCFRSPSGDSNKSRWPVADYWQQLLDGTQRISLWMSPGEDYDALKTRDQMVAQYGQTLLALREVYGNIGFLGIVHDAAKRFPSLAKKYQSWVDHQRSAKEKLKAQLRELRGDDSDDYSDEYLK